MADRPILFDNPLSEKQVSAPYKTYTNRVMGSIIQTAGFMEPRGHGYKSTPRKAIFRDGIMRTISPGRYNIGFDYTKGFGSSVTCMYSGNIHKAGREGGYGWRIHVKLDIPFIWRGKSYTCYQAYAHNQKLLKRVGDRVSQGDTIAIEAGHGSRSARDYGSHVDLDTYFYLNGEKVHINFELLAVGVKEDEFIEQIEVIKPGATGDDVRWLQYIVDSPLTGKYDDNLKRAIEDCQQVYNLTVDGIAGENTCKALGMTGLVIRTKQNTVFKQAPVQSSTLEDDQVYSLFKDYFDRINWIEDKDDHWLFELQTPVKGRFNWYAFKEHVAVVQGYDPDLDEQDLEGDLEN